MAEFYKGTIPIIDTDRAADRDVLFPKGVAFGLTARDWTEFPEGTFGSPPSEMETIDPADWDAYYDEQERTESSLEHIYLRGGKPAFVNLDQGSDGDCWAYSTAQAWMLTHLKNHGWTPRLNPHFIATYLRRYDGGWCGASAKVLQEVGCCEEGDGPDQWPLQVHNPSLLTQNRLGAAAKNKSVEEWRDLTRQVWDQKMVARQLATCGFQNTAMASDRNFWAHSTCELRRVRVERGSWGALILNSWANWGRYGLAVLRGSQAEANGAIAIRSTT